MVSPKLIAGLLGYGILDISKNGGNGNEYYNKYRIFVHNSGQSIFAHLIPDPLKHVVCIDCLKVICILINRNTTVDLRKMNMYTI